METFRKCHRPCRDVDHPAAVWFLLVEGDEESSQEMADGSGAWFDFCYGQTTRFPSL